MERDLNKLADSLCDFVNKKIKNNKKTIEELTRNKAIEILFLTISKNGFIVNEDTQQLLISKPYKQYRAYVNDFIIDIKDNNNELFKTLSNINVGYIVSNYLLLPQEEHNPSLKNCTIFLDTPLLIGWLLEKDDNEDTFKSFIMAIKTEKVSLKILRHTYDETMELINNAIKYIGSSNFDFQEAGTFMKRLKREKYYKSDVIQLRKNSILLFEDNNIEIEERDVPEDNENMFALDAIFTEEDKLRDDHLHDFGFQTKQKRDRASLFLIYQEQPKPYSLRDAKNIFVTTSNHIVKNAIRYQREILNWNNNGFSLCVTDIFLMTILSIKNEKCKNFQNFIQKKFIIDCILLRNHMQDEAHEKLLHKLKEKLEKMIL